jgi:hypothetical protein
LVIFNVMMLASTIISWFAVAINGLSYYNKLDAVSAQTVMMENNR